MYQINWKPSVRKCGNNPAINEESDWTEICSVKSPDQEVCTKFQFHSSHQGMNHAHHPSITKCLPMPMPLPLPGFEPNLCLNEKGRKFEFEFRNLNVEVA
jgi:hypothetical protein